MHLLNVFSQSEIDYFVVLELFIYPPYLPYHHVGLLTVHAADLVPLKLYVAALLLELHNLLPRLL
jgi:hypothetical protein